MSGTLYVVSTPIGNLEDLSPRAHRILGEVDVVVCEDTRVTRKLLSAHAIEVRSLASFHAHSRPDELERLLQQLQEGKTLGLVCDAGTPLVSDPGSKLVEAAVGADIPVVPLPGPSAALAALVGSGLPAQPFVFLGFLPRGGPERREALGPYAALPASLVLYESPNRVSELLGFLSEALGPARPACVARELTKRFETFERGSLSELAERLSEGVRGEVVVVVGPPAASDDGAPIGEDALKAEARRLLEAGVPPSEAAKTLAAAFGLRKKAAYRAVLDVSGEG